MTHTGDSPWMGSLMCEIRVHLELIDLMSVEGELIGSSTDSPPELCTEPPIAFLDVQLK